jgi:hypothetical protein
MQKIRFIAGIPVLLTILLALASCDNGNSGTENYDKFNDMLEKEFSSGAPDNSAKSLVGLSTIDLDTLAANFGGQYKGWVKDGDDGIVRMVWTGINSTGYASIKTKVAEVLTISLEEAPAEAVKYMTGLDNAKAAAGFYGSSDEYMAMVMFTTGENTIDVDDDEFTIPAGTVMVVFMSDMGEDED